MLMKLTLVFFWFWLFEVFFWLCNLQMNYVRRPKQFPVTMKTWQVSATVRATKTNWNMKIVLCAASLDFLVFVSSARCFRSTISKLELRKCKQLKVSSLNVCLLLRENFPTKQLRLLNLWTVIRWYSERKNPLNLCAEAQVIGTN